MRLLVDAGNTRAKWEVVSGTDIVASGGGSLDAKDLFYAAVPFSDQLSRVAVSSVASDSAHQQLLSALAGLTGASVRVYPTESSRHGLRCAYQRPQTMGSDRWHALYAAWRRCGMSVAVVDAGSALTVDFVAVDGEHSGGFILPGRAMMLRGLRQDAARVHFEDSDAPSMVPGKSTTECVQHGLKWMWRGMIEQLSTDCARWGVKQVYVTGGDAGLLLALGLEAEHVPRLVLEGLARIDDETFP